MKGKPLSVRTKIEAGIIVLLMLLIVFSSSSAVQQMGTNPNTNKTYGIDQDYISTSKDTRLFNFTESDLRAALNYLNSSNDAPGTIWLPEGTMTVTSQFELNNQTTIIGSGTDTTILDCSGMSHPCFYIQGVHGTGFKHMIRLADFTIKGDNVSRPGGDGIKVINASYNIVFERLRIYQMSGWGIIFDHGVYIARVTDCVLSTNVDGGIKLAGHYGEGSNANQFIDCYISSHYSPYAVLIQEGSQDNKFIGCHFENNHPSVGLIKITGSNNNLFMGTSCMDNHIADNYAVVYISGSSERNRFIGGHYDHIVVSDGITTNPHFIFQDTSDFNLISGVYAIGNSIMGARNDGSGTNNTINMMMHSSGIRIAGEFNTGSPFIMPTVNYTGSATVSAGYMWYDPAADTLYVSEGGGVWKSTMFT